MCSDGEGTYRSVKEVDVAQSHRECANGPAGGAEEAGVRERQPWLELALRRMEQIAAPSQSSPPRECTDACKFLRLRQELQ